MPTYHMLILQEDGPPAPEPCDICAGWFPAMRPAMRQGIWELRFGECWCDPCLEAWWTNLVEASEERRRRM
jgi:hypothetical protein